MEDAQRFWSEAEDKEAARQLGLDGDWRIFFAAKGVQFYPNADELFAEADDMGGARYLADALQEDEKTVFLPDKLMLIGMSCGKKVHHGFVDASAFLALKASQETPTP